MNRRDLIRQVLRGEKTGRLPRALFGAGLWSYKQTGLEIRGLMENPALYAETLADFYVKLDTDMIFAGSGLNSFPAEAIGGQLAFRGEQAPLLSFPVIRKTEDARYLERLDITRSPYTLALIEMITLLRKSIPDRFLYATSWGPFTWAMILCDWDLLKEKTQTDRIFIKEICELGIRLSCAFYEPLIEAGVLDGISVPEGAVTLIPPDLYRNVVIPCERKLFDWAKERGISTFLHQCGNIRPQLQLYPETGADCISVDTGIDIGEVYDLYKGRLVTAGNVDVINVIFGGDPDRICDAVAECVSRIPVPRTGYILMPSCDLPPDTPIRNVKEFLSCADRFG